MRSLIRISSSSFCNRSNIYISCSCAMSRFLTWLLGHHANLLNSASMSDKCLSTCSIACKSLIPRRLIISCSRRNGSQTCTSLFSFTSFFAFICALSFFSIYVSHVSGPNTEPNTGAAFAPVLSTTPLVLFRFMVPELKSLGFFQLHEYWCSCCSRSSCCSRHR